MQNNQVSDITTEPRDRGVCAKCGEIAHSPERCYGDKPSTICKTCGRQTGRQRVQYCDECTPPNAMIKRRARANALRRAQINGGGLDGESIIG